MNIFSAISEFMLAAFKDFLTYACTNRKEKKKENQEAK